MKRSPRRTVREAVVVVESDLAVVVEAAAAVATTIRGTHASRANRAGSFLVFWKQPDAWMCGPAPQAKKLRRNCECHEDDRLLLNARKNRRDNKNSATRPSAGCSASRTSRRG